MMQLFALWIHGAPLVASLKQMFHQGQQADALRFVRTGISALHQLSGSLYVW